MQPIDFSEFTINSQGKRTMTLEVICLICLINLHTIFCQPVSEDRLSYSDAGSHRVMIIDSVRLLDKSRNKTIEALVRYPEGRGPFPVVVFSHGAMANKEAFGLASEHWASHGYLVIHPNHADARSNVKEGVASSTRSLGGFSGALGSAGRIERIKDITSVLDALDQIETQVPELRGKINMDAIAVAGHSFGAYVAQCQGGVRTLVDGQLRNVGDPRVNCVIPISAQGESQSYALTAESWTEAHMPALHITGTRDRSAPDRAGGQLGDVSSKVVPFDRSPAGGKYLLIINGANHVSFGGKIGRLRSGVDASSLTKSVSLAFLEVYLKQDAKAKAWLNGNASTAWLGSQAKLERKL
jgi:predicted dienelactone hydrolase